MTCGDAHPQARVVLSQVQASLFSDVVLFVVIPAANLRGASDATATSGEEQP